MDATTYSPSGVHSGDSARFAPPSLTCTVSEPSTAMIQMFCPPSRSEVKTIRSPSGLKRGWASKASPDVSCVASPPSTGSRKRSPR